MYFLQEHLDVAAVQRINVSGRGGKEKDLVTLFQNARRVQHAIYDAVLLHNDIEYKLEFKKQANTQWFDIPKYYQLSQEHAAVILIFFICQADRIEMIASILYTFSSRGVVLPNK